MKIMQWLAGVFGGESQPVVKTSFSPDMGHIPSNDPLPEDIVVIEKVRGCCDHPDHCHHSPQTHCNDPIGARKMYDTTHGGLPAGWRVVKLSDSLEGTNETT